LRSPWITLSRTGGGGPSRSKRLEDLHRAPRHRLVEPVIAVSREGGAQGGEVERRVAIRDAHRREGLLEVQQRRMEAADEGARRARLLETRQSFEAGAAEMLHQAPAPERPEVRRELARARREEPRGAQAVGDEVSAHCLDVRVDRRREDVGDALQHVLDIAGANVKALVQQPAVERPQPDRPGELGPRGADDRREELRVGAVEPVEIASLRA
jgi:hypothetical protein